MRTFLIVVFWMALWPLQAEASCDCKCVNGRVQAVCTAPGETAAACGPAACTGALPDGLAPIESTPSLQPGRTPAAASGQQSQPQSLQQQGIEAAGPTTTIPPSITGPASGPPAFSPNGRIAGDRLPSSTTGQAEAPTTTSSSTTHSNPPAVISPDPQSLCYDRQVYNAETLEYEWRRACD